MGLSQRRVCKALGVARSLARYQSRLPDKDLIRQGVDEQDIGKIKQVKSFAEASYIEPEILKVGSPTIEKFIAGEKRLAPYAFYLRDISRRAAPYLHGQGIAGPDADVRPADALGRHRARVPDLAVGEVRDEGEGVLLRQACVDGLV